MLNPDFRGPTMRSVCVTERWAPSGAQNQNGAVTITKFTAKSRTRLANLARRSPLQAEISARRYFRGW